MEYTAEPEGEFDEKTAGFSHDEKITEDGGDRLIPS